MATILNFPLRPLTVQNEMDRLRERLEKWHAQREQERRTAEMVRWYGRHDPKNEPPSAA